MASPIRKSTFGGGEVMPSLHSRVDLESYRSWLKVCQNFIVRPQGGARNRTGTVLVTQTKFGGKVSLHPFVFNETEAYILEVGDGYIRFVRMGAQVVSDAVPYEIVSPYVGSEGQDFKGRTAQSADVMFIPHGKHAPQELQRRSETNWGVVPMVPAAIISAPQAPTIGNADADYVGGVLNPVKAWWYVITSVDAKTGGESFGSIPKTFLINISSVNPAKLTIPAEVLGASGYNIYRGRNYGNYGYVGTTASLVFFDDGQEPDYTTAPILDPAYATILDPTTGTPGRPVLHQNAAGPGTPSPNSTFEIWYIVSAVGTDESYGSVSSRITSVALLSDRYVTVTVPAAIPGATSYKVFKSFNGTQFGLVGSFTSVFIDAGAVSPDYSQTPKVKLPYQTPGAPPISFDADGDHPTCAAMFDQRLILAGSDNKPDTLFGSRAGNFRNFGASSPAAPDDAFEFTLAAQTVDRITSMIAKRVIEAFTTSSEYVIQASKQGEGIGPSSVDAKAHAFYGSGVLAALAVGGRVLFSQLEGQAVREFRFDFQQDGYTADDERSVLAKHMLEGHSVVDWAYAKSPDSVVWMVRDDGILLGMTYLPQHDVIAWHRHNTDGLVEAVACVPEGDETGVYVSVLRNGGGDDKRFIERFATRTVAVPEDYVFLDCSLTYHSPDMTGRIVTFSNQTGWLVDDTADCFITGADYFVADHLDSQIVITTKDGNVYRATVIATSLAGLVVRVRFERDIPAALQVAFSSNVATWTHALKRFQFSHLISRTVSALVDGNVVSDLMVDIFGVVTLPIPGSTVTIGLPYTSELQTLDINVDSRSLQTVKKIAGKVWFEFVASRGLWFGEEGRMTEWKQRQVADGAVRGNAPVPIATGRDYVQISGGHGYSGSVTVQQRDPLPCEITSITPEVTFGG